MQDLAVETYALRPCQGRPVSDVMLPEMRSPHEKVLSRFHGSGESTDVPVHNSSDFAQTLRLVHVDEEKAVPLYDVGSGKISHVSVRYILDYVFYQDGGPSALRGIEFGDSIFDEPSRTDSRSTSHGRRGRPSKGFVGNPSTQVTLIVTLKKIVKTRSQLSVLGMLSYDRLTSYQPTEQTT